MVTAGIDCGARNTKTVIMREQRILGKGSVPTGFDLEIAVRDSYEKALADAGLGEKDVRMICGIGSGKEMIKRSDRLLDEIEAMARGANYFLPHARTAIDVGAEEARVARLDDNGNVSDSAINEKCAAGAGIFIETMARALELKLEEIGPLSLESEAEAAMNAQCVVFAESEVVGLIHSNASRADISRTIHNAVAGRIASLVRRIGVKEEVALIGGVAHNPGFLEAMKRELKIENIYVPENPEYGAAVGAALLAAEKA